MHYNLLFNGCSYTWGGELEGINKDIEHRLTHRFSHLVSEKTGLTYTNISRSGSSNERILRTTAEWFEEGNTCDHAIIQWTNRNRVEYFSEKQVKNHHDTPRYYNIYSTIKSFNQLGKSIQESFIHIQNDSNDQNNQDRCMYWMEHLLKDKCSFDYLKLQKESKEVFKEYYETGTYYKHRTKFPITYINDDILNESRIFYCSRIEGYPNLGGGHPNALGHRRIAEYIINNFDYFQ
tara:strand:- start:78 stop:782 length:705 start_codon:yes stop_codon:yes gene_type:complete